MAKLTGPRPGTHLFTADAGEWVYRKPLLRGARWCVRRRNKFTGKVEFIALGAKNRSDARLEVQERAAAERQLYENEKAAPEKAKQEDMPLRDAIMRWVGTLDVRPVTTTGYRGIGGNLAALLGADRRVRDITFPDVEKLFSETWRGRSGRTKILYRWFLVQFFKWAIDAGLSIQNPAAKVRIQKAWRRDQAKAAKEVGQALSPEDCRKLLKAARESTIMAYDRTRFGKAEKIEAERAAPDYLWRFIFLSLKTGLRRSNVLGSGHKPPLTWGNLDLVKRTLHIDGDLMKNHEDLDVPLNDELIEELKSWAAALGRPPRADEPVVPVEPGADIRHSFDAALKRAGLGGRGFRLHDLRHSFLSHLGLNVPEMPMALLAGHLPATMTQRYGTHIGVEDLRPWGNKLPALLREATGKKGLDAAPAGA